MNKKEIKVNISQPWTLLANGNLKAPGTLMNQGVRCGSDGCVLHTADTIKASTKGWNNIPIAMNHPEKDGYPVSIKDAPESKIGHLQNSRFRKDALLADLVITTTDQAIRTKIQNSREVSIGVFTDELQANGSYNGKQYNAIVQNYIPDHLAILTDCAGACSWADGCGIRNNKAEAHEFLKECATKVVEHFINNQKGKYGFENEENKLLPPELQRKEDSKQKTQGQKGSDYEKPLLPANINSK